jgi:hypothetical protein
MDSYEVPVVREKPGWLSHTIRGGISSLQKLIKRVSIAEYALLLTSLTFILLFVLLGWTWALAAGCSLATLFLVVFAVRQIGFVYAAFKLISRFNPLAALNGIFDTRNILPQSIIQKLLDFLTGAKLNILTQMLEGAGDFRGQHGIGYQPKTSPAPDL